jgi:enolase
MKIKNIHAYQILDSRGNPTIKCLLLLEDGTSVTSSVPSGASTGRSEAHELRDNDQEYYQGKSVLKAIKNINEIFAPKFSGNTPDIDTMDEWMVKQDGTINKSNIGANAILATSMAIIRAQAHIEKKELFSFIQQHFKFEKYSIPTCMFNIINGGVHANNNLEFQEFMIVPTSCSSIDEQLNIATKVYHQLKKILQTKGLSSSVGDEGGFAPQINSHEQALDLIMQAIQECSFQNKVSLALDVAATSFFDTPNKTYLIQNQSFPSEKMISLYKKLISHYPIISIEDGLAEHDFIGWKTLIQELGKKITIVGDDIFVTNSKKLQEGIDQNFANAIIIKPNQIGSVSETICTIKLAQKNSYKVIVSHRSGETNDSFIADLAVGCNAGFIKAGAPCRGERLAKYNRLLEIFNKNI